MLRSAASREANATVAWPKGAVDMYTRPRAAKLERYARVLMRCCVGTSTHEPAVLRFAGRWLARWAIVRQ